MVQDKEDIYDQQIAPLMSKIIDICQEHKIPMFANFEYAPNDYCYTMLPDESGKNSIAFLITYLAAKCDGNADRLILSLLKYGEKHGHNSAYLSMLGERLGIANKNERKE